MNSPRRGFTLIESVMAMVVTSILLVGMAAALRMTASAADTGEDSNTRDARARTALEQMRSELSTATAIESLTPARIRFSIPDRTGDDKPEVIEYTWSGTAGAPLQRLMNSSAPAFFLEDVRALELTQVVRSAPVAVESAESLLVNGDFTLTLTPSEVPVNSSRALAVFFRPGLAASVSSWRLTRVRVSLRRDGLAAAGVVTARLFTADAAGKPAGSSLASATTTISSSTSALLPSYADFALAAPALSPSAGYCIVLTGSAATVAQATARTSGGAFNTHVMRSTDAGLTWSTPSDSEDLRFQLFGAATALVETD